MNCVKSVRAGGWSQLHPINALHFQSTPVTLLASERTAPYASLRLEQTSDGFREMIRSATPEDAAQVAAIYNHYVENTVISFETEVISDSEMRTRITHGLSFCPWLVAKIDGALLGYAYASPWSTKTGYKMSVETTLYVAQDHRREGIGIELHKMLIDQLKPQDFHCALGVIALPNPGSVALHEKLGYRKVGELQEVGWKLGQWVNVGYWQLLL